MGTDTSGRTCWEDDDSVGIRGQPVNLGLGQRHGYYLPKMAEGEPIKGTLVPKRAGTPSETPC